MGPFHEASHQPFITPVYDIDRLLISSIIDMGEYHLIFNDLMNQQFTVYKRIRAYYQCIHQYLLIKQMQPEVQKFAFMVDVSGSTGGSDNYWKTVGDILSLYADEIDKYYEWDSSIHLTNKKQMQTQIQKKAGKGGTSPEVVAQEIVKSNLKKVILITDGQVSDHNVVSCDKILQGYKFTKTVCYIIASTGYGNLNMSVTCPFTRNCDNEVYEKEANSPLKKLVKFTPEDYKILDTLDDITLQNFEANYDKIEGLIIALNMGKEGNIPLKNQLVVMKNRLVKQLSKQKAKDGDNDINKEIRLHLEKDNIEGALEIVKKITKQYFSDSMTTDLEKRVSQLINLCGDLRGKYNINQIKSNKMAIAQDAKEGKIDQQVQAHDLSKNLIECPIILDEDVPQILVDEGEPILLGVQKFIVDDIAACPLRVLNYPQIKAKLKSRLSNFMGVKYSDKLLKNPFTQRKLIGAIPLGCHKSHMTVGNYTIAKMFSDGKILGNLNMFYAAIWYIIKEKEIQYLNEIEKNATEHLIFRLKNTKTMASLCGLAQFVTTELNSDLAVWYCVNSGFLNQPSDRDTFRFHVFNMNPLIDIVKALGYPIDKGVFDHLGRTKSILSTLSWFKKISNNEKKSFKQAIRCIYQNSVEIKAENIAAAVSNLETVVRFVPIDGDANKDQIEKIVSTLPKEIQKLALEQIVHIGNLMDAQKSAADIFIDYNFKPNPFPKAQICWQHGVKTREQLAVFNEVKLNPKTFRLPSTYGIKNWEQYVEEKIHVAASKLFKGRKYFEQFLNKYQKMPTKDELIIFYYNRYVVGDKVKTLPFLTDIWSEEFVEQYTKALHDFNLTVPAAIQLLENSRSRTARLMIEKGGDSESYNAELMNNLNFKMVNLEKKE